MGRTCGATNKTSTVDRLYTNMSVDDRMLFLANLIVKKIIDDQTSNNRLIKKINGHGDGTATTTI